MGMDNFLNLGIGNYFVPDKITNVVTEDRMVDGLWKIYFDGSCSKSGSSIWVVIEDHDTKMHPHAFKLQFECTNNEVEYEDLIQGLELAWHMRVKFLCVMGDS